MKSEHTDKTPALGFLTVLDHPQHGLFGGYLILNAAGRPLEFHCTAPIKPNRAQEILYGPTLQAFLYGEQIGRTLVQKAKIGPFFVCTDRRPVLAVRDHVALPVALILSEELPPAEPDGVFRRIDTAHSGGLDRSGHRLITFELGRNRLAVPERCEDDRRLITERFAELADSFDLVEPFARIRAAIEEAQKAVR